jgi:hypothetical protein
MNKFVSNRPYADPEAAARKLIEIANSVEAVQDGRIFIELINEPFLFVLKGTPEEYGAGLQLAIDRGWLSKHESGNTPKMKPCVSSQARRSSRTITAGWSGDSEKATWRSSPPAAPLCGVSLRASGSWPYSSVNCLSCGP